MNSAEAEGHSIDDAIERALQRLGVTRDKVDIEIISNSTRGLFGLGGRRARVRATLRRPLAVAPDEPPPPPAAAELPARSARPVPRAVTAPRSAVPPPAQDGALRAPDRHGGRSHGAPERHGGRSHGTSTPAPPRRAPEPAAPPTATTAPLDATSIERARSVLAEIVRLTGSQGTVEMARDGDSVRLVISGDPSGVLIGRRGQTLDALEYVVNRIIAHEDESGGRLIVDLEDYRQRRRQALEALARRVAERARRRGKPVTLTPMSPRDRRIVHLALQGDPTLTTRSAGSGFYRKVVILPAGGRRAREE